MISSFCADSFWGRLVSAADQTVQAIILCEGSAEVREKSYGALQKNGRQNTHPGVYIRDDANNSSTFFAVYSLFVELYLYSYFRSFLAAPWISSISS